MMIALAVVMVVTAVVTSVILFETDRMLDCDARSGLRIADLTLSCLQSLAFVSGSPRAKILVSLQDALARRRFCSNRVSSCYLRHDNTY